MPHSHVATLCGLLACTAALAAPELKLLNRIEVPAGAYQETTLVRGDDGAFRFVVALLAVPGDPSLLKIAALDRDGKQVAAMVRPARYEFEGLSLDEGWVNPRGEILVMTRVRDHMGEQGAVFVHNLSIGSTATLTRPKQAPYHFFRVTDHGLFQGKNLIVVVDEANTGAADGKGYATLVRVVNVDTGKTISELSLQGWQTRGKLGIDRKGNLKLLLTGGSIGLLDVTSRKHVVLWEGSNQVDEVQLVIGTFLRASNDEGEWLLFDSQELLNGVAKVAHRYPRSLALIGEAPFRFAADRSLGSEKGTRFMDLSTGQILGPAIPSSPGGYDAWGFGIVESNGQLIAGIFESLSGRYVSDHIVRYVDVKTGDVLRSRRTTEDESIQGWLMARPSGEMWAVERVTSYRKRERGFEVIALPRNRVVARNDGAELVSEPFQSISGFPVALRRSKEQQVCVVSLLDVLNDTCIHDPLIFQAQGPEGGSTEVTHSRFLVTLRQRGGEGEQGFRGYAEYEVR